MANNLEALTQLQDKLQTSKINQENLNKQIIQEIQNSLESLKENLISENEKNLNLITKDLEFQQKNLFQNLEKTSLETIQHNFTLRLWIYSILSFLIGGLISAGAISISKIL